MRWTCPAGGPEGSAPGTTTASISRRAGRPSAGRVLKVPAQSLRDWSSAWFPFGAHLIEGLFRTARNFEAMTRQREALVALGTLAAGLAHEINNPAAAATRAVDALGNAWEVLLSALGRLAEGSISADQFLALDALRREIEPPPISTDPMADADREDAVSTWLARHDVEKDWLIAAPLARAGVDVAWCERAAAVLDGAALEPGLEWVASTVSARTLLGRGEGVDPAHLRARRGGEVLLPARPGVDAGDRRRGRAREHPGHAGAPDPRGSHRRTRL